MLRKILISSFTLLPLLSAGSVLADSETPSAKSPNPAPIELVGVPTFQTQCKLLAQAIAQNPAVEEEKLVGTVYSVIGNTVMLEREDGSLVHVTLDWWERGHMGQLVGKKVVIRDVYCSRITLAPPPPPKIVPIEVPPLQFSAPAPVVPPLTPRPVAPETKPAPQVVPQTW